MEENYINTNPDEPIDFSGRTTFTYPDENGNQIFGEYINDGDKTICMPFVSEDWIEPSTIKILFSPPCANSEIRFSDIIIETKHCFNWLQKKMWKIFFGADITNL
jgi:hypothetical protein